ncbi:SRPBCC family protein [Lapillicoccus sp.]|uniref:SRPBCC family protein n=1 Tax=Lapillicoccus sp. TaxID=1909287 RepID=UPI0025CFA72F|nr:SRPBCC family protein [Lapillicoccus sp.]
MVSPLEVQRSCTYPVAVAEAFAVLLPAPLEVIFRHRYGPIPPIQGVSGQDGPWARPGQTRVIHLAGGGTMREELTAVETPTEFRYRITDLTGPLKALATSVDGAWRVEPAGSGASVTWRWTVHPASSVAAVAMPVFGRLWQGYAALALDELEGVLLPH